MLTDSDLQMHTSARVIHSSADTLMNAGIKLRRHLVTLPAGDPAVVQTTRFIAGFLILCGMLVRLAEEVDGFRLRVFQHPGVAQPGVARLG